MHATGKTMRILVVEDNIELNRQIKSQGRHFLKDGGFTETLYHQRQQSGAATQDAPVCPDCGKPMTMRTARKGPRTGQPFWGCSAYPECKGTRLMEETVRSDVMEKNTCPVDSKKAVSI